MSPVALLKPCAIAAPRPSLFSLIITFTPNFLAASAVPSGDLSSITIISESGNSSFISDSVRSPPRQRTTQTNNI